MMKSSVVVPVFAGIDVGASELVLVLRKVCAASAAQTFLNTPAGPIEASCADHIINKPSDLMDYLRPGA